MATFKKLTPANKKISKSFLNQLLDVTQEDVSGSATRQKYQVFVTGGVGPGVTSSLFQTVYDQDFTLQTSNPIFDTTVGLWYSGSTVLTASTGEDSAGKLLFASESLMMREKVDIYRQFSQTLLGNANTAFFTPFGSTAQADRIEEGLFLSFKRLFARDQIKRGSFAMRFYTTASKGTTGDSPTGEFHRGPNLYETSESGSAIFTDAGATTNKKVTFGGQVADIVDANDTSKKMGLIFYDHGTLVLDVNKIISGSQHVSGVIGALNSAAPSGDAVAGQMVIGDVESGNPKAKFIPDLMVSASIDDIVEHFMSARFSSGTLSSMTFQNVTNINSTLIFCNAGPDEFNYSSNPTFTDSDGRLVVVEDGLEDQQRSVTFPTTIGLYDANNNLLAVAKTSRPVEKRDDKDITYRVRLDY